MIPKAALAGRQASPDQQKATNFRSVHQLTYRERLYAKTGETVDLYSRHSTVSVFPMPQSVLTICRPKGSYSEQVSTCSKSAYCSHFQELCDG